MNTILSLTPYILLLPQAYCFTLTGRGSAALSRCVDHSLSSSSHRTQKSRIRIRPIIQNEIGIHSNTFIRIASSSSADEQQQSHMSISESTESSFPNVPIHPHTQVDTSHTETPEPLSPREMTIKLQSYIMNIRRIRPRKEKGQEMIRNQILAGNGHLKEDEDRIQIPPPHSTSNCRKTIDSLLYTLQHESHCYKLQGSTEDSSLVPDSPSNEATSTQCEINAVRITEDLYIDWKESFNQAIIQAIRAAADFGNYLLISKILSAAITYSNAIIVEVIENGSSIHHEDETYLSSHGHLLESRVFGEAIVEMTRTKANISKIKKVWSTLLSSYGPPSHESTSLVQLASPPTAFELNAMTMALASRGNIRAALNLYKDFDPHHHEMANKDAISSVQVKSTEIASKADRFTIESDAYTAGILCKILEDSIAVDGYDTSSKSYPKTTYATRTYQSPCWQWKEVEKILDDFQRQGKLNNHVYSLALKVNTKAAASFTKPGRRHLGAKFAMRLLERMKKDQVSPDVVTCSAVMSAFDRGYQWKAALSLLRSMEKSLNNQTSTDRTTWKLPPPNVYTYSIAASSCARCGLFDEALTVLESLRNNPSKDTDVNVWVYNSILSAFDKTKCTMKKSSDEVDILPNHVHSALNVLEWMKEDAKKGFDTLPDTVTYNTVISTIQGNDINSTLDHAFKSGEYSVLGQTAFETIINLLEEMKMSGVQRDSITYRNAIVACQSNATGILQVLHNSFHDEDFIHTLPSVWGSVSEGKEYLFHTATSVAAKNGDMLLMTSLFDLMHVHGIETGSLTMSHLIKSLWVSNNCEDLMITLNAMKGDMAANQIIREKYDIGILASGIEQCSPMIEEYHYSNAINGCLQKGELFLALKILHAMKLHDLTPNRASLQRIILAYCKLATDASRDEFSKAREESLLKKKKRKSAYSIQPVHAISRERANAALEMMKSIDEPSIKVQSAVASACAAAGMWIESRDILWSMHIQAITERKNQTPFDSIHDITALKELPKLHRSLLKLCARSGNVQAALVYADAIQDLSSKLSRGVKSSVSTHILSEGNNLGNADISAVLKQDDDLSTTTQIDATADLTSSFSTSTGGIGMRGEDWKLLMIAASKSAHWKVCLGTLQFIKPFVEQTHPRCVSSSSPTSSKQPQLAIEHNLQKQYDGLSRALTAATLAFEIRSQYAWSVRSIDDWIEWSGRRPPREAVYSVCRILGARGLGNQLTSVVGRVLAAPLVVEEVTECVQSAPYETSVYIEAISILYKNGLYDNADELYAKAISNNHLPWVVMDYKDTESQLQLDLHGMSVALAHSAVRVSLQHLAHTKSSQIANKDILIITGRGKRSLQHLKPVLRPEVQRMLVEEFYPPIGTSSVPGNMGALKVSSADVGAWLERQQREKGARFLMIADILRSISLGSRLKMALSNKLSTQNEGDSNEEMESK